jgi:hypothetical protein
MDFWTNLLVAGGLIVAAVVCGRMLFTSLARAPSTAARAEADDVARAELDALPKCLCGAAATDPLPVLKRDRGAWDWLRTIFAAPPRYKRIIDAMGTPAVCRTHAHVADAKLDEFVFRMRSAYAELNAKLAIEAAAFEQEGLARQLAESLTAEQRRATRGRAAVQLLSSAEARDAAGA